MNQPTDDRVQRAREWLKEQAPNGIPANIWTMGEFNRISELLAAYAAHILAAAKEREAFLRSELEQERDVRQHAEQSIAELRRQLAEAEKERDAHRDMLTRVMAQYTGASEAALREKGKE